MVILVDPRSNYAYGSFYIQGLINLYGTNAVRYSYTPFKGLNDMEKDMRFVVKEAGQLMKYFLHLNDSYKLNDADYEWCDVYGCVNANYEHYPKEKYTKLISLVPSFGVRVEKNALMAICNTFLQFIPIWRDVLKRREWNKYTQHEECNPYRNIKHYFTRRYRAWQNRYPLSAYENTICSEKNYIFFLSTLWYNDDLNKNDETVNLRRAHYIRACQSVGSIRFEGGLLGDKSSSNEKFSDVLAEHGEPFGNWIDKTKRSALVFNTPAFWNCHGWKLGEYLALGKCIVSTKLSNDLPYPLEHGVNIHFVEDDEAAMQEAVEYILSHPSYRHILEKGARAYWEKYGTPEASLKLLGIK